MSIDPKILEKRRETAVGRRVDAGGLPALTGSEKQIKWATTIREAALALALSDDVRMKFSRIVDSTWWIANKGFMNTMKFKEPAPHQLVGGAPDETTQRVQRLLGEPVESQREWNSMSPSEHRDAPRASTPERANDCADFAASVSKHPKKAEAAVLALLSRLYKGQMKEILSAKAMTAVIEAQFEDGRDLEAIKKLLGA